ncbi:MAG: AraC family transcriptional regulator ligand-binding domain-containing protein [Myxococcota bacterium]
MTHAALGQTFSGAWVRGLTTAFEHIGFCGDEILQRAGLEAGSMTDPLVRVSEPDLLRLWQSAIDMSGDPLLGLHAGEHMSPRQNQVLAMLAVSGRTLGDGLSSVIKYQGILSDVAVARVDSEGVDRKLSLSGNVTTEAMPHRREFLLSGTQTLVNAMTLSRGTPKQVRFRHAAQGDHAEYERVFRCEVCFEQPETSIVFEPQVWDMALEVWDPFLRNRLESLAIEVHERTRRPTFIAMVSRAIEERLGHGACSLAETAKRMRLSQRTLQRRLHDDGAQFRDVLDATRRSIVRRTQGRQIPEQEVARLAGFGSVRALRRAIERWADDAD